MELITTSFNCSLINFFSNVDGLIDDG